MKQLYRFALIALFLSSSAAQAAVIFYETTNVDGSATINYGMGTSINDAPVFSFAAATGNVNENLSSFSAGNYTLSFTLEGLAIDINEDGSDDFFQSDFGPNPFSITSSSFYLASLPPLSGNSGPLSWAFNPYSGDSLSYDFDIIPGPNSNSSINGDLAGLDFFYSGGVANGVMNADVSWDLLRIELTSVVPEPSIFALFSLGLFGMLAARRKSRA